MLTVTQPAQEKIAEILDARNIEDLGLRIRVLGRAVESFAYDFSLMPANYQQPDDTIVETERFKVYIDQESAPMLQDAVINFDTERNGFLVENPNPVWAHNELGPKVADVIMSQINPGVASHGGAIMLVDVKETTAYVRMLGGCQGCGMAGVTLTQGVEQMIKSAVPEISTIVDITHHAAGTNPYFASGKSDN